MNLIAVGLLTISVVLHSLTWIQIISSPRWFWKNGFKEDAIMSAGLWFCLLVVTAALIYAAATRI